MPTTATITPTPHSPSNQNPNPNKTINARHICPSTRMITPTTVSTGSMFRASTRCGWILLSKDIRWRLPSKIKRISSSNWSIRKRFSIWRGRSGSYVRWIIIIKWVAVRVIIVVYVPMDRSLLLWRICNKHCKQIIAIVCTRKNN